MKPKQLEQPASLVVAVADLHVNSTVGLCPPTVSLDDGGTYRASKAQRAVWSAWCVFWDGMKAKAEEKKARIYVIVNGDLNDFNIHDNAGLISRVRSDVIKMSVQVLEPALAITDRLFIVRGTEAHTGRHANLEEVVAKDVSAGKDEQVGTWSWYWLKAEFGGVTFDASHHPQTFARRPWTASAAAARQSAIIRDEHNERGDKVPDIALRGHVHHYIPGAREPKPQVFYLPPWQLTMSYARRLGATACRPVGGLWFLCSDSEYQWNAETWKPRSLRIGRKTWRES